MKFQENGEYYIIKNFMNYIVGRQTRIGNMEAKMKKG